MTNTVDLRLERIRARLTRAGVQQGAPLSEDRLASFETQHGFDLPPEYRAFLLRVGDGGEGPAEDGVSTLCSDDNEAVAMRGAVQEAFPSEDWLRKFELWRDEGEGAQDDLSEHFPGVAGLLYLGETSSECIRYYLVVQGPARGEVWSCGGDEESGTLFCPAAPDFIAWYEAWLDNDRDVDVWPYFEQVLEARKASPPPKPVRTLHGRIAALRDRHRDARMKFGPALSEAEVAAFEHEAGVILPTEYRTFLLELGNGYAAGRRGPPGQGLLPLGEVGDYHLERAEMLANLRKPFLGTSWRSEDFDPPPDGSDEGVLVLGCNGDASYFLLVVTGATRGQVWSSSDAQLEPVAADFLTWYEQWFDACDDRWQR